MTEQRVGNTTPSREHATAKVWTRERGGWRALGVRRAHAFDVSAIRRDGGSSSARSLLSRGVARAAIAAVVVKQEHAAQPPAATAEAIEESGGKPPRTQPELFGSMSSTRYQPPFLSREKAGGWWAAVEVAHRPALCRTLVAINTRVTVGAYPRTTTHPTHTRAPKPKLFLGSFKKSLFLS